MTGEIREAGRPSRSFLRRWLKAAGEGIGMALGRFPAAVLAVAALAVIVNIEIGDRALLAGIDAERLSASLLIAAALCVAATIVLESTGRLPAVRSLMGFATAILAGAIVWFVRPPHLLAAPLAAASLLAIPLPTTWL